MAQWKPSDYWDSLDSEVDLSDDDEQEVVLDRIVDDLDDVEEIFSITPTTKRGSTVYVLVSYSRRNQGGLAVDLRTVAVDLSNGSVRVTDNGLWVPEDPAVLAVLSKSIAAARGLDDDDDGLVTGSAVDLDVDSLLSLEVSDSSAPSTDSGRNDRAPDEVYALDRRLREAGVSTDERYNRLEFGGKAPWEHDLRGTDSLLGNYGVYATQDDRLVLLDVDDPDSLDVELPGTYTVGSPHGDVDRSHRYYVVEDFAEEWRSTLGVYNPSVPWGDVRASGGYVVGPGSQLDGCSKDPCSGSPPCSDPDGGRYEVLIDRPIARVETEDLLPALDAVDEQDDEQDAPVVGDGSGDESRGSDRTETDAPEDAPEAPEETTTVTCYECNRLLPEDDAVLHASTDEREFWICSGGCP